MSSGRAGELFEELIEVVATLWGEGGCPWDREQTRETLKPLMVEELYEALDAIDKKDECEIEGRIRGYAAAYRFSRSDRKGKPYLYY